MQTPAISRLAFHAVFLFITCATGLHAQTTPAVPAKPASDEVLTLADFTVTAQKANGYRATNSITATGIGTQILDAPVAISVLTGDLIKDLGNTRLPDALVYVPGVMNASYESNISIRGYNGQQLYRNGFYRRQTYTTWNIDRVEVIKGAAAVFYGVLRPGGVINYLTGKPSFDGDSTDASVTVGSDSFMKAAVYSNVQAGDSVAFRVGLGASDGGAWRNNDFDRQNYQGLSTTWRISKNQELNLDLEHVQWKFTDLRGIDLALTNSRYYGNAAAIASGLTVNQWMAANYPTLPVYDTFVPDALNPKGRYYVNGSDTWSDQESDTADLTYRWKISDGLVFSSSLNYARDFFEEVRTISNDQSPYANGNITYQFGHFGNTRRSFNFNNKLTWRLDFSTVKNTFQFGQEYLHLVQTTPGILTSAGNFQDGFRSASFTESPAQSAQRSGTAALAATGITYNITRHRNDDFRAYFAMGQSVLFDDNLHLLYGVRYNDVARHVTYSQAVGNREATSSARKATPEYGVLYKLTKELSAFATFTKSLEVPFGADVDGRPIDPVDNTAYDLGVKTALFGGRVNSTLSYYWTQRDHIATNDTAKQNATGLAPYFIYDNTLLSRGLEADINVALTDSWSLLLGYTHDLENKFTRSTVASNVGLPLGGVPKDYFTLWTRYDFKDGEMKGFFLGGGLRASTAARVSTDQIGISINNVATRAGFVVFDALVGYRFKLGEHPVTASLSVKNIADRVYREGADGGWGSPRQFQLTLGTKF